MHGQHQVLQTLTELAPYGLSVSIISYGELYEGAYYARDPERAVQGLTDFLRGKDLLPLTVEIMERFAIVRGRLTRSQRQQVGDMDLLIAATALTHNLILMTRNLRDFQLIPGLRLYRS